MAFLLGTVGAHVVGSSQSGTSGVDTGSPWRLEMTFLAAKLDRALSEDDG